MTAAPNLRRVLCRSSRSSAANSVPKSGIRRKFTDQQIILGSVDASEEMGRKTRRISLLSDLRDSDIPAIGDSRNFPVSAGILLFHRSTSAISGQYPASALPRPFAKRLTLDYVVFFRTSRQRSCVGTATAIHRAAAAAWHPVDVGARIPEAAGDWRAGNCDAGGASGRSRLQHSRCLEIFLACRV